MEASHYDKVFKIIIDGTTSVGKSALINRYLKNNSSNSLNQIKEVDFLTTIINLHGNIIKLQLWDSSGHLNNQDIVQTYQKNAHILIFIFDITNTYSFEFVTNKIMNIYQQVINNNCTAVLVGNKCDQLKQRKIKFDQANYLGSLIGRYIEVSSSTGQNVQNLFIQAVSDRMVIQHKIKGSKTFIQRIKQLQNHNQSWLKQIQNKILLSVQTQNFIPVQNDEKQQQKLVKIILLGEQKVGKTSIIMKYIKNQIRQEYIPTIGIDFAIKQIQYGAKLYKLKIWDTAGMEKFKSLPSAYYKGANVAFVVFDKTRQQSFLATKQYIQNIKNYNPRAYITLVGTKSDLEPAISSQIGWKLAIQQRVEYLQVNVKNEADVQQLFMSAIRFIYQYR